METPIHLLKLTRMLRLFRLLQKIDRYTRYSSMILALLLVLFSMAAHWLACVWYVIAERERMDHTADWNIGWIPQLADRLQVPVQNLTTELAYITALYFTCTSLTSVGFGNVSANTYSEKVFSIVVMLIGALMHAAIFGNVTAIVQRMYAKRSQYDTKWNDLRDFMALYQVPKELRQRILDYFQTMWSLNHGIEMTEILRDFPEELRGDVCMHIHRELLQLPIFMTASLGCQKLLALQIKDSFCAPGEYLVHRGDALHCIFYLCNGSMEVVQADMVVAILGKGDLVGCDIEHLLQDGSDIVIKSSSDVRALTYCDLKCLHIAGLVDVLRLYEEFKQEFSKDIQHDLTYNLREGFEADAESVMEVSVSHSHILPSISEDNEDEAENESGYGLHVSGVDTDTSPICSYSRSTKNAHELSGDIELVKSEQLERQQTTRSSNMSSSDETVLEAPLGPLQREKREFMCSRTLQALDTQMNNAIKLLQHLSQSRSSRFALGNVTDSSTQTEWSLEIWLQYNRAYVLQLLNVCSHCADRCPLAAHAQKKPPVNTPTELYDHINERAIISIAQHADNDTTSQLGKSSTSFKKLGYVTHVTQENTNDIAIPALQHSEQETDF